MMSNHTESGNYLPLSEYGSDHGFWSGGRRISGQWKWSNREIITTFSIGQPVVDPSYEYVILDNNAGYALASSPDGLLYTLCEGDLSWLISVFSK